MVGNTGAPSPAQAAFAEYQSYLGDRTTTGGPQPRVVGGTIDRFATTAGRIYFTLREQHGIFTIADAGDPNVLLARSGDHVHFQAVLDAGGLLLVRDLRGRFDRTMRTLHSERLVLEPVDSRNARELWRILGAPDLRRFQDIPRLRADEFERQVRARPRALQAQVTGRFEWLVRGGEPRQSLGWVSLRVNERAPEVGEIGYSLIEAARGFGYATEALHAVVSEAFAASDLNELQACCVPENVASRAVLDRAGFREVRLLRGGAMIRGRHVDVLLYSCARGQWTRMRQENAVQSEHA